MNTSFTRIRYVEKPDIQNRVIEKWSLLSSEDKSIEEKNSEWNEFINELRKNKLLTNEQANKYIEECVFK